MKKFYFFLVLAAFLFLILAILFYFSTSCSPVQSSRKPNKTTQPTKQPIPSISSPEAPPSQMHLPHPNPPLQKKLTESIATKPTISPPKTSFPKNNSTQKTHLLSSDKLAPSARAPTSPTENTTAPQTKPEPNHAQPTTTSMTYDELAGYFTELAMKGLLPCTENCLNEESKEPTKKK